LQPGIVAKTEGIGAIREAALKEKEKLLEDMIKDLKRKNEALEAGGRT
jgi:hypothetical protein